MTTRELDELGSSLVAQSRQSEPRPVSAYCPGCGFAHGGDCDLGQRHADSPATGEWTAEQLRRLGDVLR